ncbi:MAG: hypothetical protein EKK47_17520 [Burkholderiales bacterium]|nr:MAG: hypothetical protein EKK47_17520 [Burkholderiales bacterium]
MTELNVTRRGVVNTRRIASIHARWALLRLLFAAALLLPLSAHFGQQVIEIFLPAYTLIFEWVADDFQLLRLAVDHEGADLVLRATVMWKHIMFLGPHVIYPDPRGTANASTLVAHALQGPLTAILVAIAWPTSQPALHSSLLSWRECALRTLFMLPLLGLLIMLDMPLVLAGELWHFTLDALAPDTFCALVSWKFFMQGGGRYALAMALAGLAVFLGRGASERLQLRESSNRTGAERLA